jgi:hypothetical protein
MICPFLMLVSFGFVWSGWGVYPGNRTRGQRGGFSRGWSYCSLVVVVYLEVLGSRCTVEVWVGEILYRAGMRGMLIYQLGLPVR